MPPFIAPPLKTPSRNHAYQVSQLSNNEIRQSKRELAGSKTTINSVITRTTRPKVVVNNSLGGVLHSTSKDILNDDMREVFSAESRLA